MEHGLKAARCAKSALGAVFAALYLIAFAAAYYAYVSASGQWPDGGWLFLAALPYTFTMVRLAGSVDFSGDALPSVLIAATFGGGLAYAFGALIEAIARILFSGARRIIRAA
jgi:hypothetical protein